ncbi:MAG: OsmC family protein [Polaromonas sp.]|uniref:OsmC family protein n=1 Tax=Polaromonas sp. TaxID=1869339 RepID=UPI002732205A|nr:OsmC family protein [Polaromonas sp.]MDP1740279.1 OsmC family protein [Polaromonas sp.]MDP1956139.1 OsmC family protein [Polaromonas sp.]MDP3356748.1 OsmC family protein [Polaromonas sp.]MDP3752918.1 OsmC family protein [Polaromonas sp.]
MSDKQILVHLTQVKDYRFQIAFDDGVPELTVDEPPPLGSATGPSPVQLLTAAVGSCLSDSLLFALRKFKQNPEPMRCEVQADVGRNPEGRMRVLRMKAVLTLGAAADQLEHLQRALDQFEEFCTVTQSVRAGIEVTVEVYDAGGARLK